MYRYGAAINDEPMKAYGGWLLANQGSRRGMEEGSLGRVLPALFDIPDPLDVPPRQPLPRDVWFDDIQVMAARDRGATPAGFFVAAKGGHNAESHNHNDVGTFIVYVDGKPVVVDAGVETYRRQTFSPQRYEIWTMQSGYHTLLPTFVMAGHSRLLWQAPGRSFAARSVRYQQSQEEAMLTLDLGGAYPCEAGIRQWNRTIVLRRGVAIEVTDSFTLERAPALITLSLLTPSDVSVDSAAGVAAFLEAPIGPDVHGRRSGTAQLQFTKGTFDVAVERIAIDDARPGEAWGDHLNRLTFSVSKPPLMATWVWQFRA